MNEVIMNMKKTARFFVVVVLGAGIFAARLGAEDLRLDGINYDAANPAESLAIINGKLLKAGESTDGYQVVKVDRLEVRIKNLQTSEESVLDMNKVAAEVRPAAQRGSPGPAPVDSKPSNPFEGFLKNLQKKKAPSPSGAKVTSAKSDTKAARNFGMISAIQDLLPGSGALGAYRDFMNHMFRGEFEKAKTYVESGSGAASSLKSREDRFGPCVANNQGKRFSSATYHLDSQKELSGGQVQLIVTQRASGDPPGSTSAFGSVTVTYKHQATMVKGDKGWKVRSFQFSQTGGGEMNKGKMMHAHWLCMD